MKSWVWPIGLVLLMASLPVSAQEQTAADCLACHNDSSLNKETDGKTVSLFVDENGFQQSIHGSFTCTDCHSDTKDYPHDPPRKPVSCGECHGDIQEGYDHGLHAQAREGGNAKAASCLDCHGNAHTILPSSDPQSPTYRTSVANTCGRCHSVKFVMEGSGISAQPFFSYRGSVHGKAVQAGSLEAAICTDCHHSHDIHSAADPHSPIFKFNVPATCGTCHEAVTTEYNQSIHGQAIQRGNGQSPVCTDCHGIHSIKSHIDPTSSVASLVLSRTTCAKCHEGVRLSQEMGIPGQRASSYLDSYHGLASELGSTVVANCASCHGIHNILPSTDPRSTISKANLVTTCGKCHPGAGANFVRGQIHAEVPISEDIGSIVNDWVKRLYIWLIVVVIGGMLAHNFLVWRKKALAARRAQDRSVVRMTPNQRWQHLLMLISFITLAITGFALKYPDSWIAWLLGSSETFRRTTHRTAGVVMIAVGLYHVWYVWLTREGRQGLKSLFPVRRDIRDFVHNMLYYLGRRSDHPKFGEFTYAEKAEYWALVWGVLVMGITGLMGWFEVEVTQWFPRWAVDVALTVHFYEAILATLAIIVWHFYQVIFDPDVYPLNWAFWDGRMSVDLYRKEHPLAYEELMKKQRAGLAGKQLVDDSEGGGKIRPSPAGSGDD